MVCHYINLVFETALCDDSFTDRLASISTTVIINEYQFYNIMYETLELYSLSSSILM